MANYTYRNESGLSRFLIFLLLMLAVLNCVAVVSGVMAYEMLLSVQKGAEVTIEVASIHDTRQAAIGGAQLGAAVFAGMTFLIWVHRMSRNAHSIENANPAISPGWAVGYYFVPILNVWKPYQAMKQTYEAFIGRASNGVVLPLWWFAWLLASALARISTRFARRDDTLEELLTGAKFAIIADAMAVLLDIAAILLVIMVSRACAAYFEVDHFEAATLEWE